MPNAYLGWSNEGTNVLANSLSNLGTQFRDAMQRQEQNTILQQQKEASAKIPGLIKAGDLPGAAQAAFDANDPTTGRQLLLSDLARQQNSQQMTEIGKILGNTPVNFGSPSVSGAVNPQVSNGGNPSIPPIIPPKTGASLSMDDVVNLALKNGATRQEATLLGAISRPESGGNPNAYNDKGKDNSLGVLQINLHAALGPERLKQFGLGNNPNLLFDPDTNVRAGLEILRTQGPQAWSTYKSGAYRQYMPQAFRTGRNQTPETAAKDTLGGMSMSPIASSNDGYGATASVNPNDVSNPGTMNDASPLRLPQRPVQTATNDRQMNDGQPIAHPNRNEPAMSLDNINAERAALANSWNNVMRVAAMPGLGDGGWRMVSAKQEQIKFRLQQLDNAEKQIYDERKTNQQREDTNSHWSIDREDKKQAPINEMFLKKYQAISDAGDKAVPKIQTLKAMAKQLDDPNFVSGTGAEYVTALRKLGSTIGVTDPVSTPNELFSALKNNLTLAANNGSLGAGVSNADVSFLASINPSEQMTPQGAKALTGYLIAVEQNRRDAKKAATQYAEKNGLGFGFDNFMSDWAEQHPVITPDLQAQISPSTAPKQDAQQPPPQQPSQSPQIQPGTVDGGHIFLGGDPSDPASWAAVRK